MHERSRYDKLNEVTMDSFGGNTLRKRHVTTREARVEHMYVYVVRVESARGGRIGGGSAQRKISTFTASTNVIDMYFR